MTRNQEVILNNKSIDYRKINFLQKSNRTVNLYNRCDFKLYIAVQSECYTMIFKDNGCFGGDKLSVTQGNFSEQVPTRETKEENDLNIFVACKASHTLAVNFFCVLCKEFSWTSVPHKKRNISLNNQVVMRMTI